jgi:hypothetical protein
VALQPLEITPGVDPSWVQRRINEGFTCPLKDPASIPGHQNPDLNFRAPDPNAENSGLSGEMQQAGDQHPFFTTDAQGFDGNLLAPDMSFFDLFSEYCPPLSGFDNPSVLGDLFR